MKTSDSDEYFFAVAAGIGLIVLFLFAIITSNGKENSDKARLKCIAYGGTYVVMARSEGCISMQTGERIKLQ